MTVERRMVDKLIDRGIELSPDTEWTLLVAHEVAVLLPSRTAYRGLDVVTFNIARPVVVLSDAAGIVSALYLNLLTGAIGPALAEVGIGSAGGG